MFKVIEPNDILMSLERTIAITTKENVRLVDYKKLSWNEFIDLTVVDALKTKERRFNTKRLKEVKALLSMFCGNIDDVVVRCHEEPLPLVFEFDEENVILMAQFGAPIKIGGSY